MGFFKDVEDGVIDNEEQTTTAAEAIEELGKGMTAEEALASLDSDYNPASDEIDEAEVPEEMENIDMDLLDNIVLNKEIEEENTASDNQTFEESKADSKDDVMMSDNDLETTVITKGTTIRGGISSDCSLDVMGVITGDVECQGKLSIYGAVSGNTTASEIVVDTPTKLVGDLNSSGCIKVVEGSIVIGTITAASAYISGAVKGDIDVQGPVIVDSSAIILGNITAGTLQFNNGAVLEGICTIGVSDLDLNSYFEN